MPILLFSHCFFLVPGAPGYFLLSLFFLLTELPLASFKVGLLVSDSLSFPLSRNGFISLLFMKDHLARQRTPSGQLVCYHLKNVVRLLAGSVDSVRICHSNWHSPTSYASFLPGCFQNVFAFSFWKFNYRALVWISLDLPSLWFTQLCRVASVTFGTFSAIIVLNTCLGPLLGFQWWMSAFLLLSSVLFFFFFQSVFSLLITLVKSYWSALQFTGSILSSPLYF